MPQGKGTYGSKVGRPPKKAAPKKAIKRLTHKPVAPKNQKARGRQSAVNAHKAVTKPKSAVKRRTLKPVAPKNQKAKGRAIARKAPRPKRGV